MNREEYWFWITNINDIYQYDIKKILSVFSDPEEVFKATEDELVRSGTVSSKKAHDIVQSKNSLRNFYKLDKLRRDGIRFIYYGSDEYPERLAYLQDLPYALYVKGKLPDQDLPTAGIVGARACSGYGREMTLKYSQTLAVNSIQIISGMALGVDTYASKGALQVGGKTFVILGSGIDVIYPQQNIELYYQIIMNQGGVISEYPLSTQPVGWQFPHRNRLISAFSDKLLVMEAKKHSGTLTTAACALAQGKDVYALPGKVTDPLSEGCNRMIADGAGVLLSPEYLLEEYYGSVKYTMFDKKNIYDHSENKIYGGRDMVIDKKYSKIYSVLDHDPINIEEIARECGMRSEAAAAILTEMELMGLCTQMGKDCYSR